MTDSTESTNDLGSAHRRVDVGRTDGPASGARRSLLRAGLVGGACALCAAAGFGVGRRTRTPGGLELDLDAVAKTDTTYSRRGTQPDALFRVHLREKVVALTFDDGPDPRYTPEVLRMLKGFGATATFFIIGSNAAADPSLLRTVIDAGHSIGNHTYDHIELELLDPAQVDSEIDRAQAAIVKAGAKPPRMFRPPRDSPTTSSGCSPTRVTLPDGLLDRLCRALRRPPAGGPGRRADARRGPTWVDPARTRRWDGRRPARSHPVARTNHGGPADAAEQPRETGLPDGRRPDPPETGAPPAAPRGAVGG
ncbi:MAG: polysaccharide deacetylase family protein [Microthrixaceae bacterium]